MKTRMKMKIFTAILAPMVIVPTISSCSKPIHMNFLTNYVNSLDATSLLGIAPDYFLSNYKDITNDQFLNFTYLSQVINTNKTNIQRIPIMDGQEVNIKGISRLQPYTILFNEWEKVDEWKFKDIIPNIAYTSMGDSDSASRWWDDDTEDKYWYEKDTSMYRFYNNGINEDSFNYLSDRVNGYKNKDSGVSPQKALLMAANDLDNIYGLNGKLTKRANDINLLFKKRVENITSSEFFKTFAKVSSNTNDSINTTNKLISTNLNVGIIMGGSNDDSSNYKFLTPNALPLFYSQQVGKGLGFNFPNPTDNTNEWRRSRYVETFIQDSSGGQQLTDQFKEKFDYLIYVQSRDNVLKRNTPNLSGFSSLLTKNDESNNNINNRIYTTTYYKFYDAIWGMYGYNHILDDLINNIMTQFTSYDTTNLDSLKTSDEKYKLNLIPTSSYITLRPNISSEYITDWNYQYNKSENE